MKHRHLWLALSMTLGLLACSSDKSTPAPAPTGHASKYPTCNEIIQACHPFDVGEGPIHDCHDLGHSATSDADCIPKKADCLRICVPSAEDGGTGAADGGADAG